MQRPFRFGIQASAVRDRAGWVALARRAEESGYSTLTMPDHFTEQLAPIPALMCAADATERLRVGALVWDTDYRHPVVFAKELATLDVLSEGRLEIGLGAGWMTTDYEQSGIPYDPARVRIDRFEEALAVIKGAFAEGRFDHRGAHYTIDGYEGLPKPLQRPRPPLLIGGGGKRMLTIAARQADIVGINGNLAPGAVGAEVLATMTAESVDEKLAVVRAAAGERFADIELNVRIFMVTFTDQRAATLDGLAAAIGYDRSGVEATPFALVGTPRQMADDLLARRERWGFSYVVVGQEDLEQFAPVVAELAGR